MDVIERVDARSRIERIWQMPQIALSAPMGGVGYALPSLDALDWHAIGDANDDNWLVAVPGSQIQPRLTLSFRGRRSNVVILGRGSTVRGVVDLATDEATVIFGEQTGVGSGGNVAVHGMGCGGFFFFGSRSTVNQASFFLLGDNARIVFGEDCMLAHAITVRTGDDHSMIDLDTGAFLNPPGPILVEPHVWLCPETYILKGTTIGFGSVVALKSIVNCPTPRFSLVGGQPARVLRERVTWDRPGMPRPGSRHQLVQWANEVALAAPTAPS
jgi:carbonic anhydrase/acetyltransferase-like protein (isoleucine patch superfamily)